MPRADNGELRTAPSDDLVLPFRTVKSDAIGRVVRLGSLVDGYLVPGDVPDRGLVVVRTVESGELVPASAVDDADRTGLATVVVPQA